MISLPFPSKPLWPNGRTKNVQWKASLTANHKLWARVATQGAINAGRLTWNGVDQIQLRYTVQPNLSGPAPDRDNCVAAMKAYQDGIAQALGANDRFFATPKITIGERSKGGNVIVEIGA